MNTTSEIKPENSNMPVHHGVFASLWKRLAQRPDTEHEAALIRIVLALISACYMIIAVRSGNVVSADEWHVMALIALMVPYSVGAFLSILIRPQISVPRRILSMVMDIGATTYAIYFLRDVATPFFGLYLFNACGNGFRFGPRYLYLSNALSITGFTFVLIMSEYWTAHQTMGIGLLIVLIVIPMYFATLVRQLHSALARMRTMANHDTLTGLPNRLSFYEQLQHALRLAERNNTVFAVVFIDLDGFKPINDELGHATGDAVLKSVARRLEQCVRKCDVVARFGGDEFVIILTDVHKTAVPSVARKIIDTVAMPHEFNGKTVTLSSSMGIATYPDNGRSVDDLVAQADAAMYRSKRAERNCFCLDGEPQAVSTLTAFAHARSVGSV